MLAKQEGIRANIRFIEQRGEGHSIEDEKEI